MQEILTLSDFDQFVPDFLSLYFVVYFSTVVAVLCSVFLDFYYDFLVLPVGWSKTS